MKSLDSAQVSIIIGVIGIFGVIIGALISGVFTLLSQRFLNQKQRELFAHQKEQDNKNRKITALEDLMALMEDQATALADVWGFIRDPSRAPFLGDFPLSAWDVLKRKGYRRKVWSTVNSPTFGAIATYARANKKLLSSIVEKEPLHSLDEESRATLNAECKATADLLSTVLEEIITRISQLNDTDHDPDDG